METSRLQLSEVSISIENRVKYTTLFPFGSDVLERGKSEL